MCADPAGAVSGGHSARGGLCCGQHGGAVRARARCAGTQLLRVRAAQGPAAARGAAAQQGSHAARLRPAPRGPAVPEPR